MPPDYPGASTHPGARQFVSQWGRPFAEHSRGAGGSRGTAVRGELGKSMQVNWKGFTWSEEAGVKSDTGTVPGTLPRLHGS